MHHWGYVFQQLWNEDDDYRTHVRRRARPKPRPTRTTPPRRRPDAF